MEASLERCLLLQVSDQELEAIARGEGASGMDVDTEGAGGEATRRLLGDYQTPARYIAASSSHDAVAAMFTPGPAKNANPSIQGCQPFPDA